MRILGFLLLLPTLAFARQTPTGAFVKLKKPTMLQTAALTDGQPYYFGPYVLPVTPDGQVVAVNPNLPDYLKRLNCGIPGATGPGKPAQCFSILNYKKTDPNSLAADEAMADSPFGGGGFPGLGGGGGGGRGGPGASGGPYGGGSPYQTASLGDPSAGGYGMPGQIITGPEAVKGLCTMDNKGNTQEQTGWCKTITETLTRGCAATVMDKIIMSGNGINGLQNVCQPYGGFDKNTKILFWTQFMAALVQEESGWNPRSSGDGGKSKGLMSLSEGDSANGCHCQGLNSYNIWEPEKNLKCGIFIALKHIARDREIGRGPAGLSGARGAARYYGPFGDGQSNKRARMASKTNSYCVARAKQPGGGVPTSVAEAASAAK